MSLRFQADNDLRYRIVKATRRREPSIDFQTAKAAGIDGLDDLAVLRLAAFENRILVSHDRHTMSRHLAALILEGISSPGVLIVVPQHARIASVVETLVLIWSDDRPEEWENAVKFIPF